MWYERLPKSDPQRSNIWFEVAQDMMSLLSDPVIAISEVEPEALTMLLQQSNIQIAYLEHFLITHT